MKKEFQLESKNHLRNMKWFEKNANLEAIPHTWEDLAKYNLPPGILERMKEWEYISKSPYSNSFYSSKDVTFANKPNGSMRVSDHWNFTSMRDNKLHSRTNINVENNIQWCMGIFNADTHMYDIIHSEMDVEYLLKQEIITKRKEYLTNPDTINRKRLFHSIMKDQEIFVDMIYNGREVTGVLHKYCGDKISVIPTNYADYVQVGGFNAMVLYSNNEFNHDNLSKFILTDKSGNIIEDPHILPANLK